MKQYNIRVTSTLKVVLTIVLVPSLTITPLIVLGALYGPDLPDWLLYTIIYSLLIVAGVSTLAIVKRASPKAILTLDETGFNVDFTDKGIFARKSFRIETSQVKNFSIEGDSRYDYMSFSTTTSPSSFNISAASDSVEDQGAFSELDELMTARVAAYNEASGGENETIANRSMYETGLMKALAVVFIVLLLAALLANLFMPAASHVPWSRVLVLMAFGLPLTYKVWVNNYAKVK